MAIKMIVCDMDGTLLNNQNQITSYTAEVLKKIQEKGILLTIASGRSHYMMKEYYEQINMRGYMVGVNGIELFSFKDQSLEKFETISYHDIFKLCEVIFRLNCVPILMYDDRTLVIGDNDYESALLLTRNLIKKYSGALPNIQMKMLNEIPGLSINKMCTVVPEEKIEDIVRQLNLSLSGNISLMLGGKDWIEIMPKHIDKSVRIQQIMEKENISGDELMVFGDSQNDIGMLKLTKNSYAMLNASDEVKECAYHIARNHNHDGVAREIEEIFNEVLENK